MLFDPSRTFDDNVDHGPFIEATSPERSPFSVYDFLGVSIHSPLGIAAGPLPTSRHTTAALQIGFDIVTYKTQRAHRVEALPFPNCVNVESMDAKRAVINDEPIGTFCGATPSVSITNSFGNPSRGAEYWIPDVREALKSVGPNQVFILSVYGSSEDDLVQVACMAVKETSVNFLELNVSCPNVCGQPMYCDPKLMRRVLLRIREHIGWSVKLIVKLGALFGLELIQLLEAIHPYIDGICAINSVSREVNFGGRTSAGICGTLIKPFGLRMVESLHDLRKKNHYDYQIMGCGGVLTLQDFKDYRDAGADVVMCAARLLLPEIVGFVHEVLCLPLPSDVTPLQIGANFSTYSHCHFFGNTCNNAHAVNEDPQYSHRVIFNVCNRRLPDVPRTIDLEVLLKRLIDLEKRVDQLQMDKNGALRRYWTIDGPYLLARELQYFLPIPIIEVIASFQPEIF